MNNTNATPTPDEALLDQFMMETEDLDRFDVVNTPADSELLDILKEAQTLLLRIES